MEDCIPNTKMKIESKPILNNTVKSMQQYLRNLRNEAAIRGQNKGKHAAFKQLKVTPIEEKQNTKIKKEGKPDVTD